MKKYLILAAILFASMPLHATTWYATSSSTGIDTASLWKPTQSTSCAASGTALVWGAQANGDVFNSNGCTALAVDTDPGSVSKQVTLITDSTNGGGFTYATATNITIHANITATKTVCLVISGSTGGLTISGNITGGSTSAISGITDSHTSVTVNVIGNITGGSVVNAAGYSESGGGPISITGNATGGSAATANGFSGGTGNVALTGNCVGSDTVASFGCSMNNTGAMTVIGSLINGKRGSAVTGTIYLTPSATNYILFPKNSSYSLGTINGNATEMPTDPGVSNVKSGVTYGSLTGTLASSSVGASSNGWN